MNTENSQILETKYSTELIDNQNTTRKNNSQTLLIALLTICLIFVTAIAGYFAYKNSILVKQLAQIQVEQLKTETVLAPNEITNPIKPTSAPDITEGEINQSMLIKMDGKILFIDPVYNYRLDLSILQHVTLTSLDTDEVYEFEMYPKENHPRFGEVSVARFGISEPKDSKGLSLADFAKNAIKYKEGENDFSGKNSPLVSTTLNKYKAITWEETMIVEGPSNTREYLIDVGGKYVRVQMYSWNEKNFRKADSDLKNILKTFEVAN